MKYFLFLLLGLSGSIAASAQKNDLYADAGVCLAYTDPGSSLTYNHNFNKHIGLGAGVQEYTFHAAITNVHQLTSSVYGEFRYNMWRRKKGRYFSFLDLGKNFYSHNNSYYRDGDIVYTVPHDDGFYTGLGFGYMHYMAGRHGGPYLSLKIISNSCNTNAYNTVSNDHYTTGWTDASLVVSIGFKF